MAKGMYMQEGKALNYKNGGEDLIAYGDVVVLPGRIGVAECEIPAGGIGTLSVSGVYELPAETGVAFALGDTLYWNATSGVVSKTAASNTPCGWAAAAKESSAAKALVKIG